MILDIARQDVVKLLKKSGIIITPDSLVYPPKAEMGELSLPLFNAAKEQGKNPAELANELAESIEPKGLIGEVHAAGPYINFFLNRAAVATEVLGQKKKKIVTKKEKIMVEFVSPNINKPLHLGHVRNVFLGESVAQLLEATGKKVIRACLVNDLGIALMKAAYAYQNWHNGSTPEKLKIKSDKFVGDLYVQFDKESQGNKAYLTEAAKLVQQWEAGDVKTKKLWKMLTGWAEQGIKKTLARLHTSFDVTLYESKLWKDGKTLAHQGLKRGIFITDETGGIVAPLEDVGLPNKVVLRGDGTNIYVTTDLMLGDLKFKKYKLDRALWIVGNDQDLYLKQLFAIYTKLGYKWVDMCEHVSYGFVNLPEGRMKSREGKVVEADDLLDELRDLALHEIEKRDDKLSSTEAAKRAEVIGQAALRFFLLSVGPKNAMVYNPAESLSFTGKTGPYLLYTYARLNSILAKTKLKGSMDKSVVLSDVEWSLVSLMAKYEEMVAEAAEKRDPSLVANYTFDLAKRFADFYESTPVLKTEDAKLRAMRILLVTNVKKTIGHGLKLLTITPLEKM